MISFEEARGIALAHLTLEMGLMEEHTREIPHGWYFLDQSTAFIKSRDFRDSMVGGGGLVVSKEDGSVYRFGSAFPLERNLAAYEFGIRYDNHNLVITAVHNMRTAVNRLYAIGFTYVVPEVEHGITWRIAREYPRMHFEKLLQSLPATISNCGSLFFKYEQLLKLARSQSVDFQLIKHRGGEKSPHT